jgi:tetratricopeptide (TPR) repeat protein
MASPYHSDMRYAFKLIGFTACIGLAPLGLFAQSDTGIIDAGDGWGWGDTPVQQSAPVSPAPATTPQTPVETRQPAPQRAPSQTQSWDGWATQNDPAPKPATMQPATGQPAVRTFSTSGGNNAFSGSAFGGGAFSGGESALVLAEKAQSAAVMGNAADARIYFERATQHRDRAVGAFLAYQYFLTTQGDHDGTIRLAEQARAVGITHPYMGTIAGFGALELGDAPLAIRLLNVVIRDNPAAVDALIFRGAAYRQLGELDGALEDLSTAIRIDPDNINARRQRAVLHHNSMNYDAAVEDYTAILQQEPGDTDIWMKQGLSQLNADQPRQALRSFDRVLADNPRHADATARRGDTFRKMGRFEEAGQAYEAAKAIDPNNAVALNGILIMLGDQMR